MMPYEPKLKVHTLQFLPIQMAQKACKIANLMINQIHIMIVICFMSISYAKLTTIMFAYMIYNQSQLAYL